MSENATELDSDQRRKKWLRRLADEFERVERLLPPLFCRNPVGNPQKNGIKFFATLQLLELVKDQVWLVKVTNAVTHHRQKHNASKKNHLTGNLVGSN